MLFATKMNQVNLDLVNYQQEIEELEARLELLREQKKQLENFAQQLQSAEAAAESALQQVNTAVMMVRAIDPEQVSTFKAAVDSVFSSNDDLAQLSGSVDVEVVESNITVDADNVNETEDETVDVNSNGHAENLTAADLDFNFTASELRKIAKGLKIKSAGRKKSDYAMAIAKYGISLDRAKTLV